MAIAIFQTFSWFNFSVSDPSNEGLRRKMKWPENATTLYFFHWATSKQGQKPTCEIEAYPNSNIVLLDLWQRSSRKDHGIFNVFQWPIFFSKFVKVKQKGHTAPKPWSLRGLPSRSLLRRDLGFVVPVGNTTHTMSRIFTTILRSAELQSW